MKTELKNTTVGVLRFTKFNVSSGPLFVEITRLSDDVTCVLHFSFHGEPDETINDLKENLEFSRLNSAKIVLDAPNATTAYLGYVWKGKLSG